MGSVHTANLVRNIPEANLVAICDIRLEVAQEVANDLGILRVVQDYHELLHDDEIEAGKAYAKNQMEEGDAEEVYTEYLTNYLVDLAVDDLGEIMEELIEEEGIDAQYLTYEMEADEMTSIQVAMLFSKGDLDSDLEDILDALEM